VLCALELNVKSPSKAHVLRRQCVLLRQGLNTGMVVAGSIGANLRMDYTAVGDTTNVAARIQSACEPGAILIGENDVRSRARPCRCRSSAPTFKANGTHPGASSRARTCGAGHAR